jgi:hypothetical protein
MNDLDHSIFCPLRRGEATCTCQPSLFDVADNQLGPFQNHSATSLQAALDNYPRSGGQRARVLLAIAYAGEAGLTDEEIAEATKLSPSSARPRRIELLQGMLICGAPTKRKTKSGSHAQVWRATIDGLTACRHLVAVDNE